MTAVVVPSAVGVAAVSDVYYRDDTGLVKVGRLRRSNFREDVWVKAAAAAGVPGAHFHDLRHTGGTLAATTGATTKELMARLGHSSPRAAMRYQHATRDRDKKIATGLGKEFTKARKRSGTPRARKPKTGE